MGRAAFIRSRRCEYLSAYTSTCSFDGLVVDYAAKVNATLLIRGLRAYSDWESELRMAILNRRLSGIETAFLMADEAHVHVSSSVIRELAKFQRVMGGFVHESISEEVYAKFGVRLPRPANPLR